MHVTRAITVSFQLDQQLPDWTVNWNRVWDRDDGLEPEHAILPAAQDGSLVWPVSTRILHIVQTLAVRLPYVNFDSLDRLAVGVFDNTHHKAFLAVGIVRNQGPVLGDCCFMRVERPEDSSFCATSGFGMVDAVHQQGQTEYVGE